MKKLNYLDYLPEYKEYYSHIFMTDRFSAKLIVEEYISNGFEIERFLLERLNEPEEHYQKCQENYKKTNYRFK